jgi:hypothetical protein
MRKLGIVALALAAWPALASAQTEEVRVIAPQDRIVLPSNMHNVWYDEFDEIAGEYALSNGRTMRLSMWGNRMYATLSGVGRMPLVAVSPYVFVTRDAAMRIAVEDPARSPPNRLNARLTVPATMFSSMAPAGEQRILMAWR